LFEESWDATLERYRSPFVFCGLADSSYRLENSLLDRTGSHVFFRNLSTIR